MNRRLALPLALLLAGAVGSCGLDAPKPDLPGDLDMPVAAEAGIASHVIDSAALSSFKKDFASWKGSPRLLFEKHLSALGAKALLDFLEETYPGCHVQSHDLGGAIYAQSGDVGTALRQCSTRCTSGCMHGVVAEAFGGTSTETITAKMNAFCREGEMARIHKPGNCAHGLGHALMFVTGNDVGRSIDGCLGFTQESMQYYCGTGVFMAKFMGDPKPMGASTPVHSACVEETLFPAACYRYRTIELRMKPGDTVDLASECVRMEGLQRRGCFHGVGYASIPAVFFDPGKISTSCARGTHDDQVVCVEGLIEKLADVNEGRAEAACTHLNGDLRLVCKQSAERKMYGLDKPTFGLYYDKEAIARRRAAAGR